jgi:hypothetical protein
MFSPKNTKKTEAVITIVTPSFEKHFVQYSEMLETLVRHCTDLEKLKLSVIVERTNRQMFADLLARYPKIDSKILLTEDILESFDVCEAPGKFLSRAGKFTFQSIKKFGGLLNLETDWALVLDSETVFWNDFSIQEVLEDYKSRKYVFYTETEPRGELWTRGDAHQVNKNVGKALGVDATQHWYMEHFHWFYEKDKVEDMLNNKLGDFFYSAVREPSYEKVDFFENILYYTYLYTYHRDEYSFVDFEAEVKAYLPAEIGQRFELSSLPFSLFGNDYLLNILRPEEIVALAGLFAEYRLAFLRLEPPYFHTGYLRELKKLPHFIATISSHHQIWLKKKVAICVSGEFRHLVHRVPEQQIRSLLGFLSGVEYDIFVHGWVDPINPLVINELKPKRYKFEERPDFTEVAAKIKYREPRIKEKRDEGSLSMFYSMQKCFELIGDDIDEYDYVVRIRPDIFMERSLKEIMVSISDDGDLIPDAVYVPSHFHSKGINDQFAIGRVEVMRHYFHSFDFSLKEMAFSAFNPEMLLLKNLLDSGAKICLVNAPYALLRHLPHRVHDINHALHEQRRIWWSRDERLPLLTDVSDFLQDKLRSAESYLKGDLPYKLFLPMEGGSIVECRVVDWDPMWHCALMTPVNDMLTAFHFIVKAGKVVRVEESEGVFFCYKSGDSVVMSFWRIIKNKLVNEEIIVTDPILDEKNFPEDRELFLAWRIRQGLMAGVELASEAITPKVELVNDRLNEIVPKVERVTDRLNEIAESLLPSSIDEIIRLDDRRLVHSVFKAFIRREPTNDDLSHYLLLLARNRPKLVVVGAILRDKGGEPTAKIYPGVDGSEVAINAHRRWKEVPYSYLAHRFGIARNQ